MIKFYVELPSKLYRNAREIKSATLILMIIAVFTLNACSRHSITLGDMIVHGSNEQEIYAPERK